MVPCLVEFLFSEPSGDCPDGKPSLALVKQLSLLYLSPLATRTRPGAVLAAISCVEQAGSVDVPKRAAVADGAKALLRVLIVGGA